MISDIGKLVTMARYQWPIPQFLVSSDGPFERNAQELLDCIDIAENDLRQGRAQYLTQVGGKLNSFLRIFILKPKIT